MYSRCISKCLYLDEVNDQGFKCRVNDSDLSYGVAAVVTRSVIAPGLEPMSDGSHESPFKLAVPYSQRAPPYQLPLDHHYARSLCSSAYPAAFRAFRR